MIFARKLAKQLLEEGTDLPLMQVLGVTSHISLLEAAIEKYMTMEVVLN
jgi:hypothetical protein